MLGLFRICQKSEVIFFIFEIENPQIQVPTNMSIVV